MHIEKLTPELLNNNQQRILELINSIPASNVDSWDTHKLNEVCTFNPYDYSYVALENGIIGIVLAYLNYGNVYIRRTCIDAKYRGKGVGRSLLNVLLNSLPSGNTAVVETGEQNIAACKLYEAVGFTAVSSCMLPTLEQLITYAYKK